MHYQAISTKFHGPTNSRGSRIIAKCAAGRLTFDYQHQHNSQMNHDLAAQALATKMGWSGSWVSGGSPDETGSVYVIVCRENGLPDWKGFEAAFHVAAV